MMFMLHFLLSCCARCKRRQSKSLAPSTSRSPSPSPPPPLDIVPPPAASKTRIRAVGIHESDMYSVLNTVFERGTYEVLLDRDTYTITAPRQLTQVSFVASSQQPRGKPPLTLPIAGGKEQILYVTEEGEGSGGRPRLCGGACMDASNWLRVRAHLTTPFTPGVQWSPVWATPRLQLVLWLGGAWGPFHLGNISR